MFHIASPFFMVSFLFFLVLRVAARAAFNFTIRRATKNTNNKKKNNENRTESLFIPFIHRVVCVWNEGTH